jgi:[protein-PII] uridylyltransferase
MSPLRDNVLAARQRLAEGHEQIRIRHQQGDTGVEVCRAISDLRDQILLELFSNTMESNQADDGDDLRSHVALVAHGGYGRRDVAPFSDVDLMLLHRRGEGSQVNRFAERLLRDVFDVGMVLGHSVRTPEVACRLACQDATICTSLIESRLLAGDETLFQDFADRFARRVKSRATSLMAAIEKERSGERIKFGETVYLLEPHVKRSRGALRDIQLVRWIGMVGHGHREPEQLVAEGILSKTDGQSLREAVDFLLWVRNELHFSSGRGSDILSRAQQLRIAELLRYEATTGMLPVEQFMRDYFRRTDEVSHVVTRFVAKARSSKSLTRATTAVFGHRAPGGFRVGPTQILATRAGLRRIRGDLVGVMQLVGLASLYDKEISPETWEQIRRTAAGIPDEIAPEAWQRLRSLLGNPNRLGPLLRGLHEVRILEKFIPAFAHARGLLQFNQYHKYTVDEHCFRAVEEATELRFDQGPLGKVYRKMRRKQILHLALLIHDVGKGQPEDHCDVGLQVAQQVAERMALDKMESDALSLLVHKHLLMNHLAFRRDTSDEQLIVRFAVEVGSPELLEMLFVMTACDLSAVGPGAWTSWKADVLTSVYARAMRHLADDTPAVDLDEVIDQKRRAILDCLEPDASDPWFIRQVDSLPATDLSMESAQELADDLRLLRRLPPGGVHVQSRFQPETSTVQFTVATSEAVTPGIFHKLTGALAGKGLGILSAQIHTLEDGLVLDRFETVDPDFTGQPPSERLAECNKALEDSLLKPSSGRPKFRRTWKPASELPASRKVAQTRVEADNSTSQTCTILDIFAADRPGLLYDITRTLFELGLSVWRAKVGTYLDQVVDAFYVTDQDGNKIEGAIRLQQIRGRLLDAILKL